MADVKLKNKNGEENVFVGVETISVPTEDGGEATFYNSPPKTLQTKTQSFSSNTNGAVLRPDNGYDGLSEVTTNVFVIPPFTAYRFLSPETEPTKPTDTDILRRNVFIASGNNAGSTIAISALFPSSEAAAKPLIFAAIFGDTSCFEITGKSDYNCAFFAFEEVDNAKLATFPDITLTLGEGVTIASGWTYGKITKNELTTLLPLTESDTVKMSGSPVQKDDYFDFLFTYASEKDTTVELSMENGDQVLSPAEGEGFHKVTVTKPSTLVPENIAYGVNIGGVVGRNRNNAVYGDFSSVDGVVSITQKQATLLAEYLSNQQVALEVLFFQEGSIDVKLPLMLGTWSSTSTGSDGSYLATKIRLISSIGSADFSSTEVTSAGYLIIDGVLDEATPRPYNFIFSITKAVFGTDDMTEIAKQMPYTVRAFTTINI